MALVANTLEGGTNNATLTAGAGGNTGGASGDFFDQITIGTGCIVQFSDVQKYGAMAVRLASRASSASAIVSWVASLGSFTETYGRIYLYIAAGSVPALAVVMDTRDSANRSCGIRIRTDRKLELIDSASSLRATSTNLVPLNAWFRLEWHLICNVTTGSLVCRIFNSPDSTTATEEFSFANFSTLAAADRVRFGNTTSTTNWPSASGFLYLENLVMGAADWPEPAGAGHHRLRRCRPLRRGRARQHRDMLETQRGDPLRRWSSRVDRHGDDEGHRGARRHGQPELDRRAHRPGLGHARRRRPARRRGL